MYKKRGRDNFGRERDEDKPGSCRHCRKCFDTTAKWIRHVTHNKVCLAAHDPEIVNEIKRESRLRTKRLWARRNKERINAEKQTGAVKSCFEYYVPVAEKRSESGKAF